MTDTQLYLAVGIPSAVALTGILINGALIGLLWNHINKRFDDAKDVWRAELRRVEEVLDARLKHLEER